VADEGSTGAGKTGTGVALAVLGVPVGVVLLIVLLLSGGSSAAAACAPGAPGSVGALVAGGMPAEYLPLVQRAGTVCPEFPAPVIAAQLFAESGFADATSPSGALGPAQFMPGTWSTWGRDTTGKGFADVHNPSDAVDAQARFDCTLATQVRDGIAGGRIDAGSSVTEIALGAYNAGFGSVLGARGVPRNSQTQAYVPKILDLARTRFSDTATATPPGPATPGATVTAASAGCGSAGGAVAVGPGGGPQAQQVAAAALTQRGLPYIWGGGNYTGPTGGGFDCSGLTSWAFHQVGLDLPRTAQTQYAATAAVRLPGGYDPASYQPGDLLFWGTAANIHHVAIAIGNGQMVHASTFGQPLAVAPIYDGDFFGATRPLGAGAKP
jgi:cell wall-associated NlpC family hydrolase